MSFKTRNPDKKVLSIEQSEGVGARVRRSIGRPELRNFDPFLMLDEFKGEMVRQVVFDGVFRFFR